MLCNTEEVEALVWHLSPSNNVVVLGQIVGDMFGESA